MSSPSGPPPPNLPTVIPVAGARAPAPHFPGTAFRWLLGLLFAATLSVNLLLVGLFFANLVLFFILLHALSPDSPTLDERYYSGRKTAADKIAIVRIDGVILEGFMGYAHRQIDQAAADPHVKAVVLRIDSPGGSITASDELHHRLLELRDGNRAKGTPGKPIVASMASLAASGGYYVAMPAKKILAERTTITGSIGVFASFPNVKELADKVGVRLDVIKAGEVKDSGSMFKDMTPLERQLWQDMIDHAFDQFIAVVEEGRPALKGKMRDVVLDRDIPAGGKPPATVKYVRRRADGGIYTADRARELGLIDRIGYLDEALAEAKEVAGLGDDFRAVTYDRPQTFLSSLLSGRSAEPRREFDPTRLAAGATPRLWYLAPQSHMAAVLTAVSSPEP